MSKTLLYIAVLVTLFHKSYTQTELRRVCRPYQLDVGIRRGPRDNEATHTCISGPLNGRCFVQDAEGGFNCTDNFQLQGGLPNRQSLCCEKLGFQLTGCFVPRQLFSFQRGFNIQRRRSVIRSIISVPTPRDQTTFAVELCFLRRKRHSYFLG
ncbi:uncharacterized protein LOC134276006 [Saccostrea cucullata]|uniref:uncharacterized protein LOC134276006 n=1 Tax=Saccostrea cuccullata TaxID=36930 RepID=UPI002ED5687C